MMRFVPRATTAAVAAWAITATTPAWAAGSLKLKNSEVQEVSGAWHLYVTIELPKAPAIAHVPMKFLFTKTAVFERALVDNHKDPVLNRITLQNQMPAIETLDVDFADSSGKVFRGTHFDFSLARPRGYEAGEYKLQVRTVDGVDIGQPAHLVLKGDNPVVDRRSITFNAKESSVRKIPNEGQAPARPASSEEVPSSPSPDVVPTGTAKPFISPDAYEKTAEEDVKVRPKGCGCHVPGESASSRVSWLPALAIAGLWLARRRRTRQSVSS